MVNYYRTDFGLFPVIVDSTIYDAIKIGGVDCKNYIEGLTITLGANSTIYDSDTLTNLTSHFDARIIQVNATSTTAVIEDFIVQDNKQVQNTYKYYQTYPDLRMTSRFKNDATVITGGNPNADMPYGCFSVAAITTDPQKPLDYINISILVSNDNMSNFVTISIIINKTTYTAISRSPMDGNTLQAYIDYFQGLEPYEEDSDPYVNGGGSSGGGGGTGDFDGTSDTIGLPSLPSLSGLNTGFFTAFVPSASQMQSVSNYLWNNAITDILDPDTGLGEKVDALKKIVANPYDAIMGCSIIPVTPPTAGIKELKMYGLLETGISLPYASTRWVQVDCGTLNIHEFWGSYLDYSPYTKTTSLYLPYIGTVSIDIDLIMAKSIQVVYYVDILSGICVAFILVDGSVKFHYQGQCSTQVPITNADYSSTISAGIGLIGNASQVVGSAVTGAGAGGIGGAVAGAVSGAISQAPAVASNVMGAKPDIRSGGAIGSSAGILSVQRPYLIIERPKQSVPAFQNHFTGYPSNVTAKVSDLTGYTEFETINLDGIALTDAEKAELDNILKGGVYL